MATLTSTGVNTSSGTLDGYYTGTSNVNTSYPLGSYLLAKAAVCTGVNENANQTIAVYISGGSINQNASGSALAGTWRQRGAVVIPASNGGGTLAQRTA